MKKLLQFLGYCAVWLIYAAFGLLPIKTASDVMGWLWRIFAPLNIRHARANTHLAMAMPQLNPQERNVILRDMWENLGRVTAESFQLDRLRHRQNLLKISNPAIIERLRSSSKGAVLVAYHGGNWELTALPATQFGLNMMGVYQAVQNPYLNALVHRLRAPFWPAGLLTKGHATARALFAHVRKGGIIGMLADVREHKGVSVPFFGHMAPSNSFPAMVALKTGCPIYAVRVVRTAPLQFQLDMVEVEFPKSSDFDVDVLAATAAIHAQFETWIKEYPAQWMWAHRRWGREITPAAPHP